MRVCVFKRVYSKVDFLLSTNNFSLIEEKSSVFGPAVCFFLRLFLTTEMYTFFRINFDNTFQTFGLPRVSSQDFCFNKLAKIIVTNLGLLRLAASVYMFFFVVALNVFG